MPSPFKRHGASRQIQPMSQAELRDSLLASEEAEAAQLANEAEYPIRGDYRAEQVPEGEDHAGEWRIAVRKPEGYGGPDFLVDMEDNTKYFPTRDAAVKLFGAPGKHHGRVPESIGY